MITEQLAIIKGVGYGLRDIGRPCLWFTTYTEKNYGALHVFTIQKEIDKILTDSEVSDINELEGKSCWVIREDNKTNFLRMSQI